MLQRIQKILSDRGLASRRKAEEWISSGRVCCNGVTCKIGDSADPGVDIITVDGIKIPSAEQYVYILLHKPRGYVTTLSDEKGRPNAAQLVSGCKKRVYPVGRLDMDSEGLLIFTNDGAFANHLMHPRDEVKKEYRVWVERYSAENEELLRRPVELDGYRISPPNVKLIRATGSKAELSVTIHEGRNRQVRRMCKMAGMQVTRLLRVAEGSLELGDLKPGKWRYLTDAEVSQLWEH